MDSRLAELLDRIEAEAGQVGRWFHARRRIDPRVLAAMAEVPRERFVPAEQRSSAYQNIPLPIGYGQTISQPFIVAFMTDLLEPEPEHVVLEVGTGSGYQSAVLARLVRHVHSVEVIPELAELAARRLAELGCENVTVRCGDGHLGWPEHAPYDRIIVTAAPDTVPLALLDQLADGGRLVIPVGQTSGGQDLMLFQKDRSGRVSGRAMLPVAFVPLTHGER